MVGQPKSARQNKNTIKGTLGVSRDYCPNNFPLCPESKKHLLWELFFYSKKMSIPKKLLPVERGLQSWPCPHSSSLPPSFPPSLLPSLPPSSSYSSSRSSSYHFPPQMFHDFFSYFSSFLCLCSCNPSLLFYISLTITSENNTNNKTKY